MVTVNETGREMQSELLLEDDDHDGWGPIRRVFRACLRMARAIRTHATRCRSSARRQRTIKKPSADRGSIRSAEARSEICPGW